MSRSSFFDKSSPVSVLDFMAAAASKGPYGSAIKADETGCA